KGTSQISDFRWDQRVYTPFKHCAVLIFFPKDQTLTACFSPIVTLSSKPQALATPSKEEHGKRKKKSKGLGKKRDPCLRKYKDFCIHGECKYVKELRAPSCICHPGYHGERCHGLSLPVENRLYTYDHTTILAVVAVVLSSVCLLVIVGLLMFRYHRRGGYDVENEEKVKLGMTNSH
ncbi:proheparin-binding EGF-like growth factor, partial [Sapajus apella]|uniref:Proheparin-binding EGF-like growth factor n=1 Tax=Sapajus apella TaxID=9515 RepID=A0A6J3HFA2_SAPAP